MARHTVWAACGLALLLALGTSGCKKRDKEQVVANRLGPVAQQATKIPTPAAIPHPNVNPQSQALKNEKDGYVASARTQMDLMQKEMASLQATTWKTAGPNRAIYDKLLRDAAVKRAAFQADVATMPNASAESWPALKAKADRDLVLYRGAFVAASSRIVSAPQRVAAIPAKLTP